MLHLRWRWIGGVDDVGGEWLDEGDRGNLVADGAHCTRGGRENNEMCNKSLGNQKRESVGCVEWKPFGSLPK